jgi:hypothetical protein
MAATVLLSFAFTRNRRLGNSALKLTMMALSIARFFQLDNDFDGFYFQVAEMLALNTPLQCIVIF